MKHKFVMKAIAMGVCAGCMMFSTGFAASNAQVNAYRVNFRTGASLSSSIMGQVNKGDSVEVISKQGDWTKAKVNGKTGYIYSQYISEDGSTSSFGTGLLKLGSRGSSVNAVQTRLKELGYFNVNPTGYYGYITKDAVMAFQRANGLMVDGIVGPQVRSKLNASSANSSGSQSNTLKVEKANWFSTVNSAIPRGATFTVVDVSTGKRFNARRMGGSNHADFEPLTSKDTAIMKQVYGNWSWTRRAVVVIYNGRAFAGSMNGMPHGSQTISSNGFNGHACIHFEGSKTHGTKRVDPDHQNAVNRAASVKTIKA